MTLLLEPDQIRGLTLWRPWPWAFTHADKRVENRPRRPPRALRYLAFHSGLTFDADAAIRMWEGRYGTAAKAVWCDSEAHPHSVITFVARVDGVREVKDDLGGRLRYVDTMQPVTRPWVTGPVVIETPEVIVLPTPVACKGAQGYWRLPPDVFQQVRDQVALATRTERDGKQEKEGAPSAGS